VGWIASNIGPPDYRELWETTRASRAASFRAPRRLIELGRDGDILQLRHGRARRA